MTGAESRARPVYVSSKKSLEGDVTFGKTEIRLSPLSNREGLSHLGITE